MTPEEQACYDAIREDNDCLKQENDALRSRLAEAEAALALASQAIDERLSGLAGDPLQDVADAINRYYIAWMEPKP